MLEALILRSLRNRIAEVATANGRDPKYMKRLVVMLWGGFELPAVFLGAAKGVPTFALLVIGFLAGGLGAALAFAAASRKTP